MASALQNVLITLCTGLASSTLRRDIRMNGFESLRILCEGVHNSYTPESSMATLANPYTEVLYRLG